MTRLTNAALCGLAAALVILTGGPALAQDAPKRAITQISGDLYRFQNNFHFSVFLVTPDGIIATDPINADAATWLKAEMDKRFDVPVRYLIYSHDHADHISGGEVFADTATVVAHAKAKQHIIDENRPTAVPDITFTDRMALDLGGKRVELSYLGRNSSDSTVIMRFPAERTVFAVDLVTVDRLPFRDLRQVYVEEWIDSLKQMEAMDFDILAPGHGAVGTRADIAAHRRYIEELREEVLTRLRLGKTAEEIKAEVTMADYKDWGGYNNWRVLNVEGMIRHMTNYRKGN